MTDPLTPRVIESPLSLREQVTRALGEPVGLYIIGLRAHGLSFGRIAARIQGETLIYVSVETVRTWFAQAHADPS